MAAGSWARHVLGGAAAACLGLRCLGVVWGRLPAADNRGGVGVGCGGRCVLVGVLRYVVMFCLVSVAFLVVWLRGYAFGQSGSWAVTWLRWVLVCLVFGGGRAGTYRVGDPGPWGWILVRLRSSWWDPRRGLRLVCWRYVLRFPGLRALVVAGAPGALAICLSCARRRLVLGRWGHTGRY